MSSSTSPTSTSNSNTSSASSAAAFSKYICIPFYYNEGYGLGDITSDEEEERKKFLSIEEPLRKYSTHNLNSSGDSRNSTSVANTAAAATNFSNLSSAVHARYANNKSSKTNRLSFDNRNSSNNPSQATSNLRTTSARQRLDNNSLSNTLSTTTINSVGAASAGSNRKASSGTGSIVSGSYASKSIKLASTSTSTSTSTVASLNSTKSIKKKPSIVNTSPNGANNNNISKSPQSNLSSSSNNSNVCKKLSFNIDNSTSNTPYDNNINHLHHHHQQTDECQNLKFEKKTSIKFQEETPPSTTTTSTSTANIINCTNHENSSLNNNNHKNDNDPNDNREDNNGSILNENTTNNNENNNNNNNGPNSINNSTINESATSSLRKSIRKSLSIKNKRIKRMLRKESKSHSPTSNSYEEESNNKKFQLNKLFSNKLSATHHPNINATHYRSVENNDNNNDLDGSPTLTSPAMSTSGGNRFALSFDTYKRAIAQKLSKEKAIELDDAPMSQSAFNVNFYSGINQSNSNMNVNNFGLNTLGVNNLTSGAKNTNLTVNSHTPNNLIPENNLNSKKASARLMLSAPSFALSISAPSSPMTLKKHEYSKSLSKEYSINDSSSHLSLTNNNAGRICMRVLYDSNTHVLTISLIQSNKLLGSDKIKLFSKVQFQITLTNREKAPKYKTTTKEYNEILNFNENFYFPNIEKDDLPNYSILIRLYGKETFGSDKLISQATYQLGNLNLNDHYNYLTLFFQEFKKNESFASLNDVSPTPNKSATDLSNSKSSMTQKPSLLIGLKYDALLGNLFVQIVKGSNFVDRYTSDKSPNTFARVVLEVDKTEVKYQTSVRKSSSSPVYDETFEFSLATYQVETAKLFIYIYAKRLLSSKNLIGCIIFDDQPGHNEFVAHLKEAITNDGEEVQKWHCLKFF